MTHDTDNGDTAGKDDRFVSNEVVNNEKNDERQY